MSTSSIDERLDKLTPKIFAYSNFIHGPELETDDIRQEMYLALLEKQQEDPTFFDNNDSYMAWYATWTAKNQAARNRSYDHRIGRSTDTASFEYYHVDRGESDPAKIAENNENLNEILDVLQQMAPENMSVIRMIYLGYTNMEIAETLKVTPAAVSQRKKNITRKIRERIRD